MQKVNWFQFLEHNDINEFILLLFDQLNRELIQYTNDRPIKYIKCSDSRLQKFTAKANKSWYGFVKNENTWFNDLSTGQLVHQIICGHCSKIHHTFENFCLLDIEIPEGKENISLKDCFSQFFEKQHINTDESDPEKWKCDNCGMCAKSYKSCKIVRSPVMFIISLKRFKRKNDKFVKNSVHVSVPKTIDISGCSLENESFQLNAIANHMGSTHGGHYNAFSKRNTSWYLIDDEEVKPVVDVHDRSAYTVFFRKF